MYTQIIIQIIVIIYQGATLKKKKGWGVCKNKNKKGSINTYEVRPFFLPSPQMKKHYNAEQEKEPISQQIIDLGV